MNHLRRACGSSRTLAAGVDEGYHIVLYVGHRTTLYTVFHMRARLCLCACVPVCLCSSRWLTAAPSGGVRPGRRGLGRRWDAPLGGQAAAVDGGRRAEALKIQQTQDRHTVSCLNEQAACSFAAIGHPNEQPSGAQVDTVSVEQHGRREQLRGSGTV